LHVYVQIKEMLQNLNKCLSVPADGGGWRRDDTVLAQVQEHLAVVVGGMPDDCGGQAEACPLENNRRHEIFKKGKNYT